MNAQELELPRHLYIESTSPDDDGFMATFAADKLVAWSDDGYGDAIDRWCKQVCDNKIVAIGNWEDNRFLQLEEEWIAVEDSEEDDTEEQRYHRACDTVSQKADMKRDSARAQMTRHKSAIEQLVQQSRDHLKAHQPPPQQDYFTGYLVAIAALATVVYLVSA